MSRKFASVFEFFKWEQEKKGTAFNLLLLKWRTMQDKERNEYEKLFKELNNSDFNIEDNKWDKLKSNEKKEEKIFFTSVFEMFKDMNKELPQDKLIEKWKIMSDEERDEYRNKFYELKQNIRFGEMEKSLFHTTKSTILNIKNQLEEEYKIKTEKYISEKMDNIYKDISNFKSIIESDRKETKDILLNIKQEIEIFKKNLETEFQNNKSIIDKHKEEVKYFVSKVNEKFDSYSLETRKENVKSLSNISKTLTEETEKIKKIIKVQDVFLKEIRESKSNVEMLKEECKNLQESHDSLIDKVEIRDKILEQIKSLRDEILESLSGQENKIVEFENDLKVIFEIKEKLKIMEIKINEIERIRSEQDTKINYIDNKVKNISKDFKSSMMGIMNIQEDYVNVNSNSNKNVNISPSETKNNFIYTYSCSIYDNNKTEVLSSKVFKSLDSLKNDIYQRVKEGSAMSIERRLGKELEKITDIEDDYNVFEDPWFVQISKTEVE